MKNKKLNISLDKMRLIMACLIIMVHTFPLESLNANVSFLLSEVFCRIAVPLFIMIHKKGINLLFNKYSGIFTNKYL